MVAYIQDKNILENKILGLVGWGGGGSRCTMQQNKYYDVKYTVSNELNCEIK